MRIAVRAVPFDTVSTCLIARSRTILIILILGESQHSLEVKEKECSVRPAFVSLITWRGDLATLCEVRLMGQFMCAK